MRQQATIEGESYFRLSAFSSLNEYTVLRCTQTINLTVDRERDKKRSTLVIKIDYC